MIDNLLHAFIKNDEMQFNYHLDKLRFKIVKKIAVRILLHHIDKTYEINTMYCNKEKVKYNIIKNMNLDYLYN